MLNVFTNLKRVTKSHIPTANAPIRIDVHVRQHVIANESNTRQKRGRPIGFKDKNLQKKNGANIQDDQNEKIKVLEETQALEETLNIIDKFTEEI